MADGKAKTASRSGAASPRLTSVLTGPLGFAIGFALCQLVYQLAFSDLLPAPANRRADRTVVILDGSKLASGESTSPQEVLQEPLSVRTFDEDGKEIDNEWQQQHRKDLAAKRKAEKKKAKRTKPPVPPPPSADPPAPAEPPSQPNLSAAEPASEVSTVGEPPEEAAATAGPATADDSTCTETTAADPVEPVEPADPLEPVEPTDEPTEPLEPFEPFEPAEVVEALEALEEPVEPSELAEEPAEEPAQEKPAEEPAESAAAPAATARRPSYVWAQNKTHVFVTASVPRSARRAPPEVSFAAQAARLYLPAEGAAGRLEAIDLELQLLRRIRPQSSSWQPSSRGPMLRLHKQRRGHWPRLLAEEEGYDAKQGTDWRRWHHPEVDKAERRDGNRDTYLRLSHERRKATAALLPRFDELLKAWAAAQADGEGVLMAKQHNLDLLDVGDELLRHYGEEREQSAALLGDTPPPPTVDEEKLERIMLTVREHGRRGLLETDRTSRSWREWRRRQKRKKGDYEKKTGRPSEEGNVRVIDM